MYSHVFLEVAILIERLLAVGTFKRLCSIVPSHMRHKAGSELKLLSTLITEELGLLHVNSLVRGQVALSFESFVTFVTRKSPLTSMSLQMPCEEVSNFESLPASLVGAGVYLGIVDRESGSRVGSDQNWGGKNFKTRVRVQNEEK